MNWTLIIGGAILFFILSVLVDFINDIHDQVEDESSPQQQMIKNSQYTEVNNIGEEILVLNDVEESKKEEIWNNSSLKNEMLNLSPNFIYMKELVDSRVLDNGSFKTMLLEHIDSIEIQFLSGTLNGEHLKSTLSHF